MQPKILISAILLTLAVVLPINAQVIQTFTAEAVNQQAALSWRSGVETSVSQFRIQRSFDGERFYQIASVLPEGSNHIYSYTDSDLFKDRINTYYYRIEVVKESGPDEYSRTARVTMISSGITRTWGSIKAMFR
ncbi:MAG: hypothetical protein V2A61_01760 [Calditrichota bacterium]